jgi:hypothetical protein
LPQVDLAIVPVDAPILSSGCADFSPGTGARAGAAPWAGYTGKPGAPHNLRADSFIGGHSDIHQPQVAYVLISALATT